MGQVPSAGDRNELVIKLRQEHYPFWSQGRPKSVTRVDILARSTEDSAPASLPVFDKASDLSQAAKKDTLNKDAALGDLLVGKLTGGATGIELPANPEGELGLFFADKAIADLWIAVTWNSK